MRKWIVLGLLVLSAIISAISAHCTQPPYKIKDEPYINKNFEDVYFKIDTHKHNGLDSVPLDNVVPSTGSTYSLGAANTPWKDVHVSSSVTVSVGTFTATSGSFYAKSSSNTIIGTSPNGTCWGFGFNNDGTTFSVEVPCPN